MRTPTTRNTVQNRMVITMNIQFHLESSDADPDPDPSDPYVFGPPGSGSGSMSQRHGSGSGSFYHHAKKVRKTLIPTVL
jgi:hypothetical protein